MVSTNLISRKIAAGAAGALVAAGLSVSAFVTPAQAAVSVPVVFDCAVPAFDSEMEYSTTASFEVTQADSSTLSVEATLGDMPGIVPIPITNMEMDASLAVTVGGAAADLTGEHVVPSLGARAPIPLPTLSGSVAGTSTTPKIVIKTLVVNATALGMPVEVTCTARPQTVPKVASKTKATVKVNKKRVATVTVKVTGKAKKPTGKVNLVLKKGKKTVGKKTVKLNKKGVAKAKFKKLKKGKHQVVAKYAGNAQYKASQGKKAFKVK